MRLYKYLMIAILVLHAIRALATTQEEFQIRTQIAKDRIKGFYDRLDSLDRADVERRSGESAQRIERQKLQREYEEARKEHVLRRKVKPALDEREWEMEKQIKKQNYVKNEKDYANEKRRLRNELNKIGDIPQEDEFDFNFNYEDESN